MKVALVLCLLFVGTLTGQSIQVYSEFRRVDLFGEIVPPDNVGKPREILSPLMARNCHATFTIVAEVPPDLPFHLYVEPSPENVFDVTVYKQMYRRYESAWIPDSLLQIKTPYTSQIPDIYHNLPSQKVETFLVDVWVPADAPTGRMKLDFFLNIKGQWTVYPMEVRVSDVVAPGRQAPKGKLPPVTASTGDVVVAPLRNYLCGSTDQGPAGTFGIRQVIRRNVLENIALAREREVTEGREAVAKGVLRGLGMDRAAFCSAAELKSPLGPEWYLRGRDFLFRGKLKP
jgi:hypothetical protein